MTLSILYLPTVITTSQMSVFGIDCAFFVGNLKTFMARIDIIKPLEYLTSQNYTTKVIQVNLTS